jgi:superfamily II DNA or RNA helicase
MNLTPYHARHHALCLQSSGGVDDVARVAAGLFDARVDLNPHQIEAALFGLQASEQSGRMLADEVGLGKTVEAGLVLCQRWAEQKRSLLVICPASLRAQWAEELRSKFGLPVDIVDSEEGKDFLDRQAVVIVSYPFIARRLEAFLRVDWDLVVCDEAHRMRNTWRSSNKLGQTLVPVLKRVPRLLLTATPLQNSLLDVYGLVSLLDEQVFGDEDTFRRTFLRGQADLEELKHRIEPLCHRTLRRQVLPYIRYTERKAFTEVFASSPAEVALHDAVTDYLARSDNHALPQRESALIGMMLRKLLASSPAAIAGALTTMQRRLQAGEASSSAKELTGGEAFDVDWLDDGDMDAIDKAGKPVLRAVDDEIAELGRMIAAAAAIREDRRGQAMLQALAGARQEQVRLGAPDKAVIFTESRLTQARLRRLLEQNGYAGDVVCFHGGTDADGAALLDRWLQEHPDAARGNSRAVNLRSALLHEFEHRARILIATEAGAEGLNLQFCNVVINYDLPWNPQRVEQRIGRCHRYGQKFDVVVVNFSDENNLAERRVLELLRDKFQLFDGLFGVSNTLLGGLQSGGVGLERRLYEVFRSCRTSAAIEAAFTQLRLELDEEIRTKEAKAKKALFDHFDAEVADRLKLQLDRARQLRSRTERRFWALSHWSLQGCADFDDEALTFHLHAPPLPEVAAGTYELVTRAAEDVAEAFVYRMTHPLGEHAITRALEAETPPAEVVFTPAASDRKITVVDELRGRAGWLVLEKLSVQGLHRETQVLVSGFDDAGGYLDPVPGTAVGAANADAATVARLDLGADRIHAATLAACVERDQAEYQRQCTRIERWERDQILAAESVIADARKEVRELDRKARLATTPDEQRTAQELVRAAEAQQARARRALYEREDEMRQKRNELIDNLAARARQKSERTRVFAIRWRVV